MDLKLTLAIFAGKFLSYILRFTGSGATAAPGLLALKIEPNFVKKLSGKIKGGSIIISGTNGKTTTARLTFDALSQQYSIIHNRQGSNLMRGIASELTAKTSLTAKISAQLAIWEVDEATLPQAIEETSAKTVVLLNLFRDQLDRYGEVETTMKKWQKAISVLGKNTTLILNSDDPGIANLASVHKGKKIFFGINDSAIGTAKPSGVLDIKNCPVCAESLSYKKYIFGHLGKYQCTKCDFKNPKNHVFVSDLLVNKDFSSTINLILGDKNIKAKYNLPGTYNAYNVIAAVSVANNLGIATDQIQESLANFTTAFGRFQKFEINKRDVYVLLIKNPTGANEVISVLSTIRNLNLLVALNDNFADGTDVSWIWDTSWEMLSKTTDKVFVTGTRAWDMAARFKYSNFNLGKNNVYEQIDSSIKAALNRVNNNDTLIILPTYTALMPIEKALSKYTKVVKWHKA